MQPRGRGPSRTSTARFATHVAPDRGGAHERVPRRQLDLAGGGRPRAAWRHGWESAATGGQGRRRVEGRGRHRSRRHLGAARHRRQGAPRRAGAARADQLAPAVRARRHHTRDQAAQRPPAAARSPPRTGDDADARRSRPRREATNRNDRGPRRDRPAGAPREGSGEAADASTATTAETRQSRPPRARTPRPPRAARPAPPPVEAKPKPKRLRAGRTHRKALLASLPPEQVPVAEQLLAGGLPAVRQAIVTQNTALKAEGKPEVPSKSLIALAEQMLPQVRAAEWRDRCGSRIGRRRRDRPARPALGRRCR